LYTSPVFNVTVNGNPVGISQYGTASASDRYRAQPFLCYYTHTRVEVVITVSFIKQKVKVI